MVIYWSMFLYIFTIGYIGQTFVEKFHIKHKYDNGISLFFAIAVLALPIFFIGMRTNYIDTKGYMEGFMAIPKNYNSFVATLADAKAPVWSFYQWIIKRFITDDPSGFLIITAIIQGIAVLKVYYKYSSSYVYSILIFFFSMSFVNMMNGIRQFMAVCLILYFCKFIFEKKIIGFLIVVIVAFYIHNSVVIWLAAYFIVQGKPWNIKVISAIIVAILAIFFVDSFTDLLNEGLEDTSYAGYTQQFSQDDGSNIFHTLVAAVPVVIAFWKRKEIAAKDNKYINIMVNMSVIAVAISLLANFTSGILLGRMPIYFTVFNFILLPWMFDNVFEGKDKFTMKLLCILGYLGYAVYYMNNSWGSKGMPYISDVLGINTWH